jgi:hypothetical protein
MPSSKSVAKSPVRKKKSSTKKSKEAPPVAEIVPSLITGEVVVPGISALLDTVQTAKALHTKVGTLEIWRTTGRYPLPFVKIGRRIFYRLEAVQKFILDREGFSTTPVNNQQRRGAR